MRAANLDTPLIKTPPTLDGGLLHLFRQHLLSSASPLGMVGAMERIELDRAQAEALAFRSQVDQFIRANPRRAKELAAKVEAAKGRAKRSGSETITVDVGDVLHY